ncbi:MAG: DUF31 family protein [Ureaplasma sp.]|nr:DUF31 family protein [Ureaplasma sp.]
MKKKLKVSIILSTLLSVAAAPIIVFSVTSCSTISSKSHTNIENDMQQYANDNSISLGFMFQPNYNYVWSRINSFFQTSDLIEAFEDQILIGLYQQLTNPNLSGSFNLLFGTSWMIDYKLNSNSSINTYYLATNAHVLDLSYTISQEIITQNTRLNFEFTFPVNSESVANLRLFLSQPQGKSNQNIEYNAEYADFFETWYQTPINKNNINANIIQYANDKNAKKFDFSLNVINTRNNAQYMRLIDSSNNDKSVDAVIANSPQTPGLDSALLKLELNPETINISSNDSIANKQIIKLKRIFKVNENYYDKNSNYISKLNDTYNKLEKNAINNYLESDSFPFALNQEINELTVGGFPGNNIKSYTYFNTGTTDIIKYNEGVRRPYIKFLNGNKISYIKYYESDTSYLGGINLLPGSSGSMVLDNNNKIVGIYWGALTSGEYGLFIPFQFKNNSSLWSRLTNLITTNSEFSGSMLNKILTYSKK